MRCDTCHLYVADDVLHCSSWCGAEEGYILKYMRGKSSFGARTERGGFGVTSGVWPDVILKLRMVEREGD